MTELSLFSGYGGFSLGLKLAIPNIRTIGYVEWEKYPQQIIAQRIKDGYLDKAPIFSDIRAFNGEGYAEQYRGLVDVITGRFPCQPFSVAGRQKGAADERNMWPATLETIRMVRPEIILLENVPGLLSSGYFGRILGDLSEAGYDAEWYCISAAECGANHKRERLWIVAYTEGIRRQFFKSKPSPSNKKSRRRQRPMDAGLLNWGEMENRLGEPPVFRNDDGCPDRVGQLKALGNGIVPAVVAEFLRHVSINPQ